MKRKPGEFSKAVIELALAIPEGRVATYGLLSNLAGGGSLGARSVTTILGNAEERDEIPFHRIVYSNGQIWTSDSCGRERMKLFKKEGLKLDKKNRVQDFRDVFLSEDELMTLVMKRRKKR